MGGEQEWLRGMAVHLDSEIERSRGISLGDLPGPNLDPRTRALVRLGAMLAMGAPEPCYAAVVSDALVAGATSGDVLCTLAAVAPTVGVARVVAAAPLVGRALGYDIERDIAEYGRSDL
jgi:alkylhydroperoxidase/carboxymuconolactone decarboxylase family protein YurZ